MDTELFKMLLTVCNQVIDKLPVGVTAVIVTVLAGYAIHKSKRLPYKVVRVGVNGSTTVTANMLKANCEQFHHPLDKSLEALVTNQARISEKVGEISETVSFIRGQLS